MSIRVLFFATLAEVAGLREAYLDASAFPDVGAVYGRLKIEYPGLAAYRRTMLCAVNSEFARFETPVKDGDEVAFFPPVSGG